MAFDLAAFRRVHRPWRFTIGRRAFDARYISAPNCSEFFRRLGAAGPDPAKRRRAFYWLLRRAFPWRVSYRFSGDPVTIILDQLTPVARRSALNDLVESLAGGEP